MLFRKKCGIDLGSDTIKIADKKNKKVVCEKNMIAVRDKTYVIAEAVGYTEPNYFSYVFKKKYGMSPIQCRRQGQ